MVQLLKHGIDLGDTGALKVERTSPRTIGFSIVEGKGMTELATVQLTDDKAKQLIIRLCQLCNVPFNQRAL